MSFVERCRQRHFGSEGGDEGFTLIELLVVLLIIGILLVIAIPTYLSLTAGANNTAAQDNLQTAITGAKAYYESNNQSYTNIDSASATVSNISQIGTGMQWMATGTGSTSPHQISYAVSSDGATIVLGAEAGGTKYCYYLQDQTDTVSVNGITSPGTYYAVNKTAAGVGGCVASTSALNGLTWSATGWPS
jgi:type IV pilus assembly protein PilA